MQGFQTPIANDSFIVDGVGAYGNMHSEHGLTYYAQENLLSLKVVRNWSSSHL